ncbi:MAG: alpha/beta hydrolase [Chitinophagales bacterium]|nr:alpha/beta hydrolase [Chitinophagales bacterium]
MKNFFRRPRNWMIIVAVLLLAPVTYSYVMMNQFSWSDKELSDYFSIKKMKPQYREYTVNGRTIFYASIGSDTLPMVLFIHGAPGSWYDYVKYFGDSNLISKAHLVSLDRPGYGKSGEGQPVTSIEEQAEMIRPLFDLNKSNQPVVLLGHSYGGPIAVKLAMDYPDEVKGMVLLAPAIDPDNEKQFAINRLADLRMIRSMIPRIWVSAYYEKKTHVDELRKLNDWEKIISPTVYMYGDKDGLVPPVNVEFAKRKILNAPLSITEFPNENHFIPWTQQDSVTKVILSLIEK